MADEIAFPRPGFTAVLVFDDPTPNTVILKRIVQFPMGLRRSAPRNFEWLEAVIATRDRANHNLDGGLKVETFAVFRNPDSTVNVPMWTAEQRPATMMDITWQNFLRARGGFHHDRAPLPLQDRRVGYVPRPPAALL